MTRTHLSQFPFALALGLTLASCVAVTVQRTTTVAGIGGPVRPWPASATCPRA